MTSDQDLYDFNNLGSMGRQYSEIHDENAVLLHMRFGVPTFNSMTTFFGNFYNGAAAKLANTGRGVDVMYTIGRIAGTVATIRIMPIILIGQALRFLFDMPSTKYYYLKPAMHTYNMARMEILNTITSNMGFTAGVDLTERKTGMHSTVGDIGDQSQYAKILPDIYNSNGSIDIFKVSTRYQRLANRRYEAMQKAINSASNHEEAKAAIAEIYRNQSLYNTSYQGSTNSFDEYLDQYFSSGMGKEEPVKKAQGPTQETTPDTQDGTFVLDQPSESYDELYGKDAPDASIGDLWLAEMRDGAQFVTFRVENPGQHSESFSNTTKESGIASTMNNMSSNARDVRFNLAQGQLVGGPIGATVKAVTSAVGSFVSGVADSVGMSGLAAMFGNGIVDIPKYWDNSTFTPPSARFKMELRAWAGDDLTRFQCLMLPLASILAGALPRSTGYQSYTSPMICEYYCKGRCQSRLGIIDSLTITRGTGNIGFDKHGRPLGIDIEFSVQDLSTVMHMPINQNFNPVEAVLTNSLGKYFFSDENTFTDYLATISSLGLIDQIYTTRRLKRNWHKTMLNWESFTSAGYWTSVASNSGWLFGAQPGRWMSAFANTPDRN